MIKQYMQISNNLYLHFKNRTHFQISSSKDLTDTVISQCGNMARTYVAIMSNQLKLSAQSICVMYYMSAMTQINNALHSEHLMVNMPDSIINELDKYMLGVLEDSYELVGRDSKIGVLLEYAKKYNYTYTNSLVLKSSDISYIPEESVSIMNGDKCLCVISYNHRDVRVITNDSALIVDIPTAVRFLKITDRSGYISCISIIIQFLLSTIGIVVNYNEVINYNKNSIQNINTIYKATNLNSLLDSINNLTHNAYVPITYYTKGILSIHYDDEFDIYAIINRNGISLEYDKETGIDMDTNRLYSFYSEVEFNTVPTDIKELCLIASDIVDR